MISRRRLASPARLFGGIKAGHPSPHDPGAKQSDRATTTILALQERIAEAGCAIDFHRVGRHAPALAPSQLYALRCWSHFGLTFPTHRLRLRAARLLGGCRKCPSACTWQLASCEGAPYRLRLPI